MQNARNKTRDALSWYVLETFLCIETVKQFCGNFSTWKAAREEEFFAMANIKNSNNMIDPGICDLCRENNKICAILKYLWNKLTLLKLNVFLEAVEKLAVTSLNVFQEGIQVLQLPDGVRLEHVQDFIRVAKQTRPQILKLKRDASTFFYPRLVNVDELMNQLDRYIQTTGNICGELQTSCSNLAHTIPQHIDVILDEDLTDEEAQRMLGHIENLAATRMDPDFRLVFLFGDGSCPRFLEEFTRKKNKILQNLSDLDKPADNLDKVNKWVQIAYNIIFGGLVAVIGNVLSIIGYSLIPKTPLMSLRLTVAGMVCSIGSSIAGLFCLLIETIKILNHQKEAEKISKSVVTDVKSLQNILEEMPPLDVETQGNVRNCVSCCCSFRWLETLKKAVSLGFTIKSIVDAAFDIWLYEEEELIETTAFQGPLSFSEFFRAISVGTNVFFLGLALFTICRTIYSLQCLQLTADAFIQSHAHLRARGSLVKGEKTELSESIRSRAALWSSEFDALEKIHRSASRGLETSESNISCLNSQFYI